MIEPSARAPGARTGGGPTVMEALFVLSVAGAALVSAIATLLPARGAGAPPVARPRLDPPGNADERGPREPP